MNRGPLVAPTASVDARWPSPMPSHASGGGGGFVDVAARPDPAETRLIMVHRLG